MKRKPILLTVLVSAVLGWLPSAQAHEDACLPIDIQLGHFDKPACQLDPEQVKQGLQLYKAREAGFERWEPPKSSNLRISDIVTMKALSSNDYVDGKVRVVNAGNLDVTRSFEVEVVAEFIKVDDIESGDINPAQINRQGPAVLGFGYLDAGESNAQWSALFQSDLVFLVPDDYYDYQVTITAVVDPRNRVPESNELDNETVLHCRIQGTGAGQGRSPGVMKLCLES